MGSTKSRILYVTDFAYEARGRRYCDEDVYLSQRLREDFTVATCHPADAAELMAGFDAVVVRNSGPVANYRPQYDEFRARALAAGTRVFTELSGKGDMAGKQHLLDLFAAGYPVIPTVGGPGDADRLPDAAEYVAKPIRGADSAGVRILTRDRLAELPDEGFVIQPRIDFRYEMSFYFVDRTLQYTLAADEDPEGRWELSPFDPSREDLEFAQRFVDWNAVDHGVQRVDACRLRDGGLLLMELEDLNPWLSLDRLEPAVRDAFVAAMKASVKDLIG